MNYTKATLKGTKAKVLADIKSLSFEGEVLYPNYPADYEKSPSGDRFIVTSPRQEVLTQGEYNDQGEEITAPIMGDYIAKLVLPSGYDTSGLTTLV